MSERSRFAASSTSEYPSVVFYYGSTNQAELLAQFDVAVLEPGHGFTPDDAPDSGTQWLAYISVGEVLDSRPYFDLTPKDWLISKNSAWDAWIVDLSLAQWPEFLVEQIARPLWQRGYRGFFLDTLDSWLLLNREPSLLKHQQEGLARAIHALRRAFPAAVLIMNRGFEVLPAMSGQVDALAFESLYRGWDQHIKQYTDVRPEDRAWLLGQAAMARHQGLPVISIDYCPPQDAASTRITMKRIRDHGIVPTIGDSYLQTVNPVLMVQTYN